MPGAVRSSLTIVDDRHKLNAEVIRVLKRRRGREIGTTHESAEAVGMPLGDDLPDDVWDVVARCVLHRGAFLTDVTNAETRPSVVPLPLAAGDADAADSSTNLLRARRAAADEENGSAITTTVLREDARAPVVNHAEAGGRSFQKWLLQYLAEDADTALAALSCHRR